ncbi:MAG: homoserine kinase [Campylobacterales bacterium]
MKIIVPATSANMGPGFDTLGIALNLKNEAIINRAKFTSISIKGSGENIKKLKKDNLFVRIFNETYLALCGKEDNFRFQFNNNIPISRGLGSSSAVITGAITGAYAMAEKPINKRDILNLAFKYELHPDNITPAIVGGFTVSLEKYNKVFYKKAHIPDDVQAVVVIPPNPMSTKRARTVLPKRYLKQDAVYNIARSSLMTAAFFSKDWGLLKLAAEDRIHQTYRMKIFPELFEVQKAAIAEGVLMSTLSGSGSTFFNIVYKNDAKRVQQKLQDKFPHFEVKLLTFNNTGVEVVSE